MIIALAAPARAETILPYTERTHAYSGWDTTVRGDLRTLGMAGAMVGLGDSLIGSFDNPASLAMTLQGLGLEFSGNNIHDGYIQGYPKEISANTGGTRFSQYPWGFSIASWSPQGEGDNYNLLQSGGRIVSPAVHTQEFRFSAARVFLDNRFSLGASLNVGQNDQRLDLPDKPDLSYFNRAYAMGASLGALYQFENRWLLGASYSSAMNYAVDGTATETDGIGHFFQAVKTPWRVALGGSWVPNRLFRAATGFYLVGPTDSVALLRDDTVPVGERITLQPRAGATYVAAEFKEFEANISAGSYLEVLRVDGVYARLHMTAGIEIRPWIFTFGWGMDEAREYSNFLYSGGIDVMKVMRKLDLIPRERRPPYAGLLPSPFIYSDEGLPRPMHHAWKDEGPGDDIIDIGTQVPARLQQKIMNGPQEIKRFGEEVFDTIITLPGSINEETGKALPRLIPGFSGGKLEDAPAAPVQQESGEKK